MDANNFLERLQTLTKEIGEKRDELRSLVEEAGDILSSVEDAYENLQYVVDTLSEQV